MNSYLYQQYLDNYKYLANLMMVYWLSPYWQLVNLYKSSEQLIKKATQ